MKKRILSLVLCAAMLLSMCLFLGAGVAGDAPATEDFVPAVNFTNVAPLVQANAQAANGPARAPLRAANVNGGSATAANTQLVTNDGVVTTKTATANDDGTYTITLTSYTTGDVKQQQTTKPTDIVLVLDQSGSMDYDMSGSGSTNYNAYLGKAAKNDTLYQQRSNGGANNLWYWLPSGKYVAVFVDKTDNQVVYTPITKGRNDSSQSGATNYWENRENLYALVDGEWHKVSYTRNRNSWLENYKCTYSIDGVVINYNNDGAKHSPVFTGIDDGYLYLSGGKGSVYTYYYFDDNGQRVTIGVSDSSANGSFTAAKLYKKVAGGKTRLDALRAAVEQFAAQIAEKAKGPDEKAGTADDVDHRIAIVGFSSDSYNNTELLTGCKIAKSSSDDVGNAYDTKYYPTGYAMNGIQYGDAKPADYKNALVYMSTDTGRQSVQDAIDALTAHGGTETNKGMDMAKQIFANDSKKGEDRNRVVVLFTDGVPGLNSSDYDTNGAYANPAIHYANDVSKDYSATIYTVGIFDGANGENPQSLPANGNWYDREGNSISTTANRFMHLVSSNYPDATDMNTPGSVNSSLKNDDSYYLSARDAATLNTIFEKISNNISKPSINLGKQAYVQDTVSDYFTAPVDGTVTVATEKAYYDESGNLQWTKDNNPPTGLEPTVTGKTVKVSGFDYDVNFVSASDKGRDESNQKNPGNFYGRRLVVTFTVEAETAFLGGNNVPTNVAESSGVYQSDGTVVENFDQPEVNVPIKAPKLTNKDANVYYGGDVPSAEQLCSTAAYDNAMADFVTISYDTNGTVSNTHDSTYTVTMTVSPKDEAKKTSSGEAAEAQSATVTSKVNVYKPEVTFKDCTTNYGDTPEYSTANFVSAEWKSSSGRSASEVEMTGDEPELTYAYAPVDKSFTKDTYVNVTVTSNKDTDTTKISGAVTFKHDKCDFPGCNFNRDNGQFIVHINVFDLTIEKTGTHIDQNQTFVFHVKGNNNDVDMQVVITGKGQQTIKNLPMGSYTITEDTGWSWKYTPKNNNLSVTDEDIRDGTATVTFENENKGTNWLTSLAEVINKWKTNDDGTAEITQEVIWPKN